MNTSRQASLANPFDALSVHPTWLLEPGRAALSRSDLWAHPLDVIALEHSSNALSRLDAAMELLLDRATEKIEAATRALEWSANGEYQ